MRHVGVLGRLIVLVLVFLSAVSCGDPAPAVPDDVRRAYEQYIEEPSENTYLGFLQANRAAARAHELTDDERGITHQLLALEVQSMHAARRDDLRVAQSVVMRIDELFSTGAIDAFDEAVPGTRRRLAAARERVAGMLE